MSTYLSGTDVLGAFGIPTIPSAGVIYTDKATVTAVQQKLAARGFDPGPIDGVYGARTAAAIKKMQASVGAAQTGVIDYGVLMALGVPVPTGASSAVVREVESVLPSGAPAAPAGPSASQAYAQVVRSTQPAAGSAAPADAGFWSQPLWQGSQVKRWQGAVGGVGALAVGFGVYKLIKGRSAS